MENSGNDIVVVAFGGNAILPSGHLGTMEEQRLNVRRMSEELGRLILDGHRVVITHGNGPQVGEIMLRSEMTRDTVPPLTLD
ncbi:MAG: carbamate kinase, partial [Chloroflexota bacterium]